MATFVNQSESTTAWSNGTQSATSFSNQTLSLGNTLLLMENGSYLLLESLGKIILEQAPTDAGWNNQSES